MAKDNKPGHDSSAGDKPAGFSNFSDFSGAKDGESDADRSAEDKPASISDFSGFSGAEELKLEHPSPLTRTLLPATEYPLDVLGPLMRGAVTGIHDKSKAALAVCAQSVMAAAALAAQTHYDLVLPTGQKQPISLFHVTVAESGDRKSSADRLATSAVPLREAELRVAYKVDLFEYSNRKQALDKAREFAAKAAKGDPEKIKLSLDRLGPDPPAPLEPMLTVPEPTFEGLTKLLAFGHPSLGLFSAEGGQFIYGHGLNSDNLIKTASGLSSIWDGTPIKRARAIDGALELPGRRTTVHLIAQPDVARKLLGDAALADQGLLSRILLAAPDSLAGTRAWSEPLPNSDVDIAQFEHRILDLLRRRMPLATGTVNELDPIALDMTAKAKRRWIDFYDDVESKVGSEGSLRPIKGLACKLHEHAARIAAVIAVVEGHIRGLTRIGVG